MSGVAPPLPTNLDKNQIQANCRITRTRVDLSGDHEARAFASPAQSRQDKRQRKIGLGVCESGSEGIPPLC